MHKENKKIKKYKKKILDNINTNDFNIQKLIQIKRILIAAKKKRHKVLIFGNGGSSSIASHFSIDLIKNFKMRCLNFNDNALLSCFSNDYGFEKWISKTIEIFADKDDVIIFISSSGNSRNMIEGIEYARKKNIKNIISFTGGNKNNKLYKKSSISLLVNSNIYNYIENTHQIWLLSIIDAIKLNKLRNI